MQLGDPTAPRQVLGQVASANVRETQHIMGSRSNSRDHVLNVLGSLSAFGRVFGQKRPHGKCWNVFHLFIRLN